MTKRRIDNHSTEFGLWLREQKEIDSSLGYITTNIDFVWRNYNTNQWMLIEEKRHNSNPKEWQRKIFKIIHKLCISDKNYKGFHLLKFENTNPNDGKIWLDKKEITKEQLLKFLKFEINL
jgi:hypothetical protein